MQVVGSAQSLVTETPAMLGRFWVTVYENVSCDPGGTGEANTWTYQKEMMTIVVSR